MATLARKVAKVVFFLLLMIAIGRTLGEPYIWVNHDFDYWAVHLFYGNTDAGVENIEGIFLYRLHNYSKFIGNHLFNNNEINQKIRG